MVRLTCGKEYLPATGMNRETGLKEEVLVDDLR
jgi:hypothetical protein